jgi:hypothetical protein
VRYTVRTKLFKERPYPGKMELIYIKAVPGCITGTPALGGYKYGDLALQVGGVSNLRQ